MGWGNMFLHEKAQKKLNDFINFYVEGLEREEVLVNHSLKGFLNPESIEWKKQYYRNSVQENVLKELSLDKNLRGRFVVLKGMCFGEYGIYESWGDRLTSDIDLLVDDLDGFSQNLIEMNFTLVRNHKWKGNSFKIVFSKEFSGIEIILELHSRLFYHVTGIDLNVRKTGSGFSVLEIEDLLMHLVGHLGFQHTFLKIHWLLDIYLIIEKYRGKINWDRFFFLIEKYQLKNSWYYTEKFLDLVFENKKPKYYLDMFVVHPKFLLFPEKHFFRYYVLKHLLKDSPMTSMGYTWWWVWQKGWRK